MYLFTAEVVTKKNYFVTLFTSDGFTALASVASVLGLALSIFLAFLTWNIKEKVFWVDDIKSFNKQRKLYQNRLIGFKDSIYKDNLLDERLISDLLLEVYRFNDFRRLHTVKDRIYIHFTLRNIKKGRHSINKQELNRQLTYIISRYDKDKGGVL